MTVDLDAVIAAEVAGEPIPVKVGGKTYKVRPEMPWDTARLVGDGDAHAAFAGLTVNGDGPAFAEAMLADNPSWQQITARLNAIYATGESAASQRSSTNGGRRSRPTSKPSTGSTSAAP